MTISLNSLLTLILVFAIAYASICGLVYLAQERLVYFPSKEVSLTPADVGLAFNEVYIETSDGEKINAWDIPAKSGSKYILFLHGNAGNIGNRLNTISLLHRLGHSIVIIDYLNCRPSAQFSKEF